MAILSFLKDLEDDTEQELSNMASKSNKFKSRKIKRNSGDTRNTKDAMNSRTKGRILFNEEKEEEEEDDDDYVDETDDLLASNLNLQSRKVPIKSKGKPILLKLDDEIETDVNRSKQKTEEYLKNYGEISTYTNGNFSIEDKNDTYRMIDNRHAEGIVLQDSDLESDDIDQLNNQNNIAYVNHENQGFKLRKEIEEALQNTNLNDNKEEEQENERLRDLEDDVPIFFDCTKSENIIELTSINLEQSTNMKTMLQFQPVATFAEQFTAFQTKASLLDIINTKQDLQKTHLVSEQNKIIMNQANYVLEMSQALRHCR